MLCLFDYHRLCLPPIHTYEMFDERAKDINCLCMSIELANVCVWIHTQRFVCNVFRGCFLFSLCQWYCTRQISVEISAIFCCCCSPFCCFVWMYVLVPFFLCSPNLPHTLLFLFLFLFLFAYDSLAAVFSSLTMDNNSIRTHSFVLFLTI